MVVMIMAYTATVVPYKAVFMVEEPLAFFIIDILVDLIFLGDIVITCLPGPTALIPALVLSGLPSESFIFEGFLPRKKGRKSKLIELSQNIRTTIIYESPYRVLKTLTEFIEYFGEDRQISLSREISKIYEETFRGSIAEAIKYFSNKKIKGEFVICIDKKQ